MSAAKGTVTIKSIAEALGISFSTVAKALRNDPRISEQTRALVQAKAAEMHYSRNYFAQSLRQRESRTVAIIANDLDIQAYAEMLSSISGSLAAHGYTTMISDSLYSEDFERKSIQNVLTRMPEAVIISPIDPAGDNLKLLSHMYANTLVQGDVSGVAPVNSVVVDHRLAGRLSAEHMLSHSGGHNLIFAGPENFQAAGLFLAGVREAYAQRGLTLSDEDIHRFKPDQEEACRRFAVTWQETPEKYTGVICFCDSMALGVYQGARELGLSIPEDVSVIGYDDGPANPFLSPPLTTIHIPRDVLAASCSQFILDRLIHGDTAMHTYHIRPTLSDRGSVRKKK